MSSKVTTPPVSSSQSLSGGRRRRRRDQTTTTNPPKGDQGSIIWTFFLLGLILCLLDVAYLMYRIDRGEAQKIPRRVDPNKAGELSNRPPEQRGGGGGGRPQQRRKRAVEDKEEILNILKSAGIAVNKLPLDVLEDLPTWRHIQSKYGPRPVLNGIDTCAKFRQTVPPSESFVAPAGAFNSGTNLMAELLIANCHIPAREKVHGANSHGVRWQVTWGKHQPAKWRDSNHTVNKRPGEVPSENILPVVTVRHPYSWFQSLCRRRYATHWFHAPDHCPNFVANEVDYEFLKYAMDESYKTSPRWQAVHNNDAWLVDNVMNTANFTADKSIVPVYVKYNRETTNHDSLAHMWNEWYRDYIDADFPRVLVRFEDLLFYGRDVTRQVCQCAGGEMYSNVFRHIKTSAKKGGDEVHGNVRTGLVEAIIRYGQLEDAQNYTQGMTSEDLKYVREHLDAFYMKMFHYEHPTLPDD